MSELIGTARSPMKADDSLEDEPAEPRQSGCLLSQTGTVLLGAVPVLPAELQADTALYRPKASWEHVWRDCRDFDALMAAEDRVTGDSIEEILQQLCRRYPGSSPHFSRVFHQHHSAWGPERKAELFIVSGDEFYQPKELSESQIVADFKRFGPLRVAAPVTISETIFTKTVNKLSRRKRYWNNNHPPEEHYLYYDPKHGERQERAERAAEARNARRVRKWEFSSTWNRLKQLIGFESDIQLHNWQPPCYDFDDVVSSTTALLKLTKALTGWSMLRIYHSCPELKRLAEKYCAHREENYKHVSRSTKARTARDFEELIVKPRKYKPPQPKEKQT